MLSNPPICRPSTTLPSPTWTVTRQQPNVAASVALRCMLRILFDYAGPIILEMQAGMGDTVFAPMYLVLQKRGVRFAFFHRLTDSAS